MVLVFLGIVLQSQIDGIATCGDGQFIHRRFYRPNALYSARCTHIARSGDIHGHRFLFHGGVFAEVAQAAPVRDDFKVVLETRGGLQRFVMHREQGAVRVGTEADLLQCFRPMAESKHLVSRKR